MGISDETVKVCKLTAPVLAKYSDHITSRLYENLYITYPDANVYFGGEQEEESKQFKNAIVFYMNNIDTIKTLDKPPKKTKHTCNPAYIKPEYCTFIEVSLLQAIKDIFGDAATEEVIDAWSEAYRYLDDIVILREDRFYASA